MDMARALRHLTATGWSLRRAFGVEALRQIEQAIADSERTHGGEIRVALESHLGALELLRGITPRQRALQAFARLGVWDTAQNNGVLIYVLWADHDVEIVADRGLSARVGSEEWSEICHRMERLFANGDAQQAILVGIQAVGALIARHYPQPDRDELSNRPALQ